MIAAAEPSVLVGCREQASTSTRERNRTNVRVKRLLGMASTRWIWAEWGWQLESRVAEEGVERGQAQITAANAQPSLLLQVLEKGHDQRSVNLFEP